MTTVAYEGVQTSRGPIAPRPVTPRPVDFRKLLGDAAWASLPVAVQHRFGLAANAQPHSYDGGMEVRANLAGLMFATVCRLIGTPLAPFVGADVPVRVDVHQTRSGGLVWDRTYDFPGHAPLHVSSTKVLAADGSLMEVVRGGLGMRLAITAEDGALHFRSRTYFLALAGLRVPIPLLLTPGRAHVIHADQGAGWFRFTLIFAHPILGRTIFQTGLFRDLEEVQP
jgi:hypothetical protein